MLGADQKAQRGCPPFGATTWSVWPARNCGLTREKRVASYFRRPEIDRLAGNMLKPIETAYGLQCCPQSHDYPVSAIPIDHAICPALAHSARHTRTTLPRNIQFRLSFTSDLVAWQQMPSFRDLTVRVSACSPCEDLQS
jgi:hypothetical protein